MPTLLLPHATHDDSSGVAAPSAGRAASTARTLGARLTTCWTSALRAWLPALEVALALLAVAFLFGRLPLPDPLDVGYRGCARIVALFFLGGVLAGAQGVTLSRSRIGAALLGLALVATASVVVAGGRTAAVTALWSALGLFHAARAVVADEPARRRLLHGIGLLCIGVLARELWHEPLLLVLREQHRHALVTEHPNTLGVALALVVPVLLAATARRKARAAACVYAASAVLVLLATFSRAAWLALGGSVLALALATRPPQPRVRRPRRASSVRIELALVVLLVLVLAVVAVSRDRTGGDTQRLRILGTSWSLFLEHWPLGVGFGSGNLEPLFPVRYLERNGESLFLFHSHDLYLDLLTGSGVAGALAALVLFVAVARVARDGLAAARHRAARAQAAGHATSFGVFLALGLVDTPLYHGRLLLLSVVLWAMLDAATDCAVRSHEPKKAASAGAGDVENPHAAVRRERHRVCRSR